MLKPNQTIILALIVTVTGLFLALAPQVAAACDVIVCSFFGGDLHCLVEIEGEVRICNSANNCSC